MSGRANRLRRLGTIRMLTEDMDRNALQTALASVAVVENTLAAVDSALDESNTLTRAALVGGNRMEWLMAEAQREVAGWDRAKLNRMLALSNQVADGAMSRFLMSRQEHEQVKQLVEDAMQVTRVDEGRRAQAAADDWFLGKPSPEKL